MATRSWQRLGMAEIQTTAQRFDKSIGYSWHATHQQICRELGRMEAAGWIAAGVPPDAGKTRKKA